MSFEKLVGPIFENIPEFQMVRLFSEISHLNIISDKSKTNYPLQQFSKTRKKKQILMFVCLFRKAII